MNYDNGESPDDRLIAAAAKLTTTSTSTKHDATSGNGWQNYMEAEINHLTRQINTIESRLSVMFYMMVITAAVTVTTNADKAAALIKAVTQQP